MGRVKNWISSGYLGVFASLARPLVFLLLLLHPSAVPAQTELGSEDDLTILGTDGTAADPDAEIKGFTVFGSTQAAYTGAVVGEGNVVVNGVLSVSSGAYFVGNSTFTGAGKIFINDGSAGQLLGKNAGGWLEWLTSGALGDNLGDHTATQTLNMAGNQIKNVSSMTIIAPDTLASALWVSTSATAPYLYVSTSGRVGIGMSNPANILDVWGSIGSNGYGYYAKKPTPVTAAGQAVGSLIGKTSDDVVRWQIVGVSRGNSDPTSDPDLYFRVGQGESGSRLTINGKGNVGIGTWPSVPSYRLHVSSGAGEAGTVMAVSTGTTDLFWVAGDGAHAIKFFGDGSGLTNMTGLADNLGNHTATNALNMASNAIFNASSMTITGAGVTGANPVFTVAGSTLNILANGNVGIGTAAPGAKLHTVETSGGSSYIFAASTATDPGSYKMVVSTTGNVGIGTADPSRALEVVGLVQITNNNNAQLLLNPTGIGGHLYGFGSTDNGNGLGGGKFFIYDNTSAANRFIINDVGNVGIGTTNPGAKLEVSGQVKITGGSPGAGKVLTSDAAGLATWGTAAGDNLGNHTATQALQMGAYGVNTSSHISAAAYQINGSTVLAVLPGVESLAVGPNTGGANTGNYSVFVGSGAGAANTVGAQNSFAGHSAGYSNTSGAQNTFLGYSAGFSNAAGWYNTFLGVNAGYYNGAGQYNTFVGNGAGLRNTSGADNSVLGYYSGYYNQSGSDNLIAGNYAGGFGSGAVNSFSSSTVIGYQAGYNMAGGADRNIFLGLRAGYNVTTGTGNIVIGYNKDTSAPGANNELNIGGVIYGNLANGKVGIGTAAPNDALHVYRDYDSGGSIGADASTIFIDGAGGKDSWLGWGTAGAAKMVAGIDNGGDSVQFWGYNGGWGTGPVLTLTTTGYVGIGSNSPSYRLHVSSGAGEAGTVMAVSTGATNLFWVAGDGAHAVKFFGDGSGLTGVTGAGDNLGDHTATQRLNMAGNQIVGVSSLTIISPDTLASSLWVSTSATTPHLYVSTNGNVGVGTTYPSQRLAVNGDFKVYNNLSQAYVSYWGGNGNLVWRMGDGLGSEVININTSGNTYFNGGKVGIGTTTPSSLLHVDGATNDGTSLTTLTQAGTGRALYVTRNVAAAARAVANLAQLSATGGTDAVLDVQQAATASNAIRVTTDGAVANFSVTGTGNLYAAGNVGIGTTAPLDKLDIKGGQFYVRAADGASNTGTGIRVGYDLPGPALGFRVSDQSERFKIAIPQINDAYERLSVFSLNGGAWSPAREVVTINKTGNVGISTGAPQARLDVLGAGSTPATMTQIWRNSGGTVISSMSDTGVMMASKFIGDGSGLSGLGGTLSGGQTPKLPYWTASNALGNSTLSQDSGGLTVMNSTLTVQGSAFSVGGSTLVVKDGKVGIGTTGPGAKLDIAGSAQNWSLSPSIIFRDTAGQADSRIWRIGNVAVNYGDLNFTVGDDNTDEPDETAEVAMTINKSRNVGIGTTDPSTHKLKVKGGTFRVEHASAGSYLDVVPDSTPGTFLDASHFFQFRVNGASSLVNAIRIKNDGNVGIGTTLPDQKLAVAGNISQTGVLIASGTGNNYFAGNVGIGTTAPSFRLVARNTGPDAAYIGVSQPDTGQAGFIFDASNGDFAGGDYGLVRQNDDLSVQLLNVGANPLYLGVANSINLSIIPGGNVGIGTTAPEDELHVVKDEGGAFGAGAGIMIENPDADGLGGASALRFMRAGATKWGLVNDVDGNATDDLTFWGAGGVKAITVKATSGNVGIGTTGPDAKLEITATTTDATLLQEVARFSTTGRSSAVPPGVVNRGTLISFKDGSNPTLIGAIGGTRRSAGGDYSGGLSLYVNGVGQATSVSQLTEAVRINYLGDVNQLGNLTVQGTGNSSIAGKVGIGTTAPAGKLDILSNGSATRTDISVTAANGAHMVSGAYTANNYYPVIGVRMNDNNPTIVNAGMYAQFTNSGSNLILGGSNNYGAGIASSLFIQYNGNVGISTGAPQARLDVLGAGSTPATMTQIWRNSGGTVISSMSDTGVMMASKFIGDGSGITGLSGDNLGNHTATTDLNMSGQAVFNASSMTISGAGVSGAGPVFTVAGSTLNVLANGNVGIGTTGPQRTLDLRTDTGLLVKGASGSTDAIISLLPASGGRQHSLRTNGSSFEIYDDSAGLSKMFWKYDGNVGIGTTAPENRLDVNLATGDGIRLGQVDTGAGTTHRYIGLNDLGAAGTFGGGAWLAIDGDNTGNYGLTIQTQEYGVSNHQTTFLYNGNVGISTGAPQGRLDVLAGGSTPADMATIWRNSAGTIVSSMSATGVMMADKFIGDGSSLTNISANAGVYTLAQMNTLAPAAAGRLISVSDAAAPYSYCVSTGTTAGAWVLLNQTLHCQ